MGHSPDIWYLCGMRMMVVSLILCISVATQGQPKQEAVVSMADGNTHDVTIRLTKYQGIWVIADDYGRVLRGRSEGKKVKLPKEEIVDIVLPNGDRYEAHSLSNRNIYLLGMILSEQKKTIFKVYAEEIMQTGNNMPVNYVNEEYYEVTAQGLERINPRKYINTLAETCPKLKSYIRETGRVRWNEVDILLGELHEMCP